MELRYRGEKRGLTLYLKIKGGKETGARRKCSGIYLNWMLLDKNDGFSQRRIAVSIKSIKMSTLLVCVYTRSLGDIWNNARLEKKEA